MKHILDSSFRYKPSFDTDVKRTFDRIRKAQRTREAETKPAQPHRIVPLKRASGGK